MSYYTFNSRSAHPNTSHIITPWGNTAVSILMHWPLKNTFWWYRNKVSIQHFTVYKSVCTVKHNGLGQLQRRSCTNTGRWDEIKDQNGFRYKATYIPFHQESHRFSNKTVYKTYLKIFFCKKYWFETMARLLCYCINLFTIPRNHFYIATMTD